MKINREQIDKARDRAISEAVLEARESVFAPANKKALAAAARAAAEKAFNQAVALFEPSMGR